MQSKAPTVTAYLRELTPDRKAALTNLRALVLKTAPDSTESMTYGMPTYMIDDTQLCSFASQKGYLAFYVCDTEVVAAHRTQLGTLDCGKSCIRFRSIDQLPLDVVERMLRESVTRHKAGPVRTKATVSA